MNNQLVIRYSLYLYQDCLRALKIKGFDLLRSCLIKLLIPVLNLYKFSLHWFVIFDKNPHLIYFVLYWIWGKHFEQEVASALL